LTGIAEEDDLDPRRPLDRPDGLDDPLFQRDWMHRRSEHAPRNKDLHAAIGPPLH
jgi:hypothetical protein